MDNFKGVRQMPPTFFETSAFKTPLSMRLSLPIEFIVSLCNLLRVKQCITIIRPVFALKLTSREIPISRHVFVHVSVRRHFEGQTAFYVARAEDLPRAFFARLNFYVPTGAHFSFATGRRANLCYLVESFLGFLFVSSIFEHDLLRFVFN